MSRLSAEEKRILREQAKEAKKVLRYNRFWKFWHKKDKHAKKEALEDIKKYRKSQSIFVKILKFSAIVLFILSLCYLAALATYVFENFYISIDSNKFLCHKETDTILAQYQFVADDKMDEGQKKTTKEVQNGKSRSCYTAFLTLNIIEEKAPVDGVVTYGTRKIDKTTPVRNTQPVSSVPGPSYINSQCYEKTIPYKTNVVYKEGSWDSDYTYPGTNGWEFICDGKVQLHIAPMDATREIIRKKTESYPYYEYNTSPNKPKNDPPKRSKYSKICEQLSAKWGSGNQHKITCSNPYR